MKMKSMRKVAPEYRHGPEEKEGLISMLWSLEAEFPIKKWTLIEIGTYLGESAAIFAPHFKKVITCDPWVLSFMQTYVEGKKQIDIKTLYSKLHENTKGHRNIEFHRYPGSILAREFKDKSVDMVYIDSWHRVIPATLDIITWLPKIKPGGIISGHDYRSKDYSEVIPAVRYILGEPDMIYPDSSWVYCLPGGEK
jgi:predicted O-methyltransferase YrrM